MSFFKVPFSNDVSPVVDKENIVNNNDPRSPFSIRSPVVKISSPSILTNDQYCAKYCSSQSKLPRIS